jgi:hypothetical protein
MHVSSLNATRDERRERACYAPVSLHYTSALTGTVDIVDIYVSTSILSTISTPFIGNKNRKSRHFLLKMNTFDLIFHDYQSRQSEKSENDLYICLRRPIFTLFVKKQEQLLGRCDRILRNRTRYAPRVKK